MKQSEKRADQIPIQKQKSKLYILCLQHEDGTIARFLTGHDYDQLWLQGSTESKAMGCYWSTYDLQGRFIDGNYKAKVSR